jgi:hypothetical protein
MIIINTVVTNKSLSVSTCNTCAQHKLPLTKPAIEKPSCSESGNSNLLEPIIDPSLHKPNIVINLASISAKRIKIAKKNAFPNTLLDHRDNPTYANANASAISDRERRHIFVDNCAVLLRLCQLYNNGNSNSNNNDEDDYNNTCNVIMLILKQKRLQFHLYQKILPMHMTNIQRARPVMFDEQDALLIF